MTCPSESEGPLAEFAALRQEIDQRISRKYAMVMTQLTIAGAIFGFVLGDSKRAPLLLIVPVSSYLLCSYFIRQARWVAHIGYYIRAELSPRVPGGLRWGDWLRANPPVFGRTFPRLFWLAPLLLNFGGVSLLALTWATVAILRTSASAPIIWGIWMLLTFDILITVLSVILTIDVIRVHWSTYDTPAEHAKPAPQVQA